MNICVHVCIFGENYLNFNLEVKVDFRNPPRAWRG